MENNDSYVKTLVKGLGKENLYLCLIYDDDYELYITEALTPYGELEAAGIGKELKDSIDDLYFALSANEYEED